MEFIIVTNNNKVFNFYKETNQVYYFQKLDFLDILNKVKEEIYKGRKLLSDPIMYNLENVENPFKSIALSKEIFDDDEQKRLIDSVIGIAKKIPGRKDFSEFDDMTLESFRFVDLNILRDGIKDFNL
ncbi:GrdX family protein [uncultured Fusobacterium sp.]|uniref:GrdX family protein n=1 Tax=uncultured Fusobacterium sp. TaxID=159267 RepID=UPI0026014126|nr:GrdX family protein [uncultured Fusobacterium sp.]